MVSGIAAAEPVERLDNIQRRAAHRAIVIDPKREGDRGIWLSRSAEACVSLAERERRPLKQVQPQPSSPQLHQAEGHIWVEEPVSIACHGFPARQSQHQPQRHYSTHGLNTAEPAANPIGPLATAAVDDHGTVSDNSQRHGDDPTWLEHKLNHQHQHNQQQRDTRVPLLKHSCFRRLSQTERGGSSSGPGIGRYQSPKGHLHRAGLEQ